MSAAEQALVDGDAVPLSLRGPAPTRVVAGYGFWLFLLSDIIIFSALFALQCFKTLQKPKFLIMRSLTSCR